MSQAEPASNPPTRCLLTVRQFAVRHPAFSESSLRWLIFNAGQRRVSGGLVLPGNGFEVALVRIGRRVFIDEERFFAWAERQTELGDAAAGRSRGRVV
jgi:hypothetical protein